jgi:outer membrane protein assembly factor BamA
MTGPVAGIKSLVLLACSVLLVTTLVRGQQTTGEGNTDTKEPKCLYVGAAISGNTITQPEIILRELTVRIGDSLTREKIEYMKSRIYSLGLFNRVDITYPPMDSTILIIDVDERWYLYPVPLFGIVDRDWSRWTYGGGIRHDNVRGRNERVYSELLFGYNPRASLRYSNPWIFGEDQYYYETGFSYSRIQNKSALTHPDEPDYVEKHFALSATLGKRFTTFQSMWINVGFQYVDVSDFQTGRTASMQGIDRFLSVTVGAKYDTRDLAEYPSQGVYGVGTISRMGIGFGAVDMMMYYLDLRGYQQIGRGICLAGRLFTGLVSGPAIPDYEHFFFGFGERMRGRFQERQEGENIFGAFTELRVPVVAPFYLHVPQVPVSQFATWKLGLYATLFVDTGSLWNRNAHPDWNDMPYGYGAGLNFLLPYSMVFRIDRAWNERGHGEWIFDLFAAF